MIILLISTKFLIGLTSVSGDLKLDTIDMCILEMECFLEVHTCLNIKIPILIVYESIFLCGSIKLNCLTKKRIEDTYRHLC